MAREFEICILVTCIAMILSMIKIICLKIIFANVIVKIILISFNCFSEYNSKRVVVSYKLKYVYGVLVNSLVKLAREKGVVR